jgi:dihydroflavonol-4-reductase
MQPDLRFWAGKRVCVTGGTGFLGWALARDLLQLAGSVRILGLQPANPELRAQLQGLDCVFADVRDAAAVRPALRDCDIVFHTAGTVAVWRPALAQMHSIHCDGTRAVVQALPSHARLIHTSSVVAVGATRGRQVLTENTPFNLPHLKVDYVHAKKAAEDIALDAAEGGSDVVVVNPGYLIGPEDFEGSIMGRFCLRVWKDKVPLIPPGGWNLVDVRDVALGHLLAAERGQRGRRYILGGENLTLVEFVQRLHEVRGAPSRWSMRMPAWFYSSIACFAELRGLWLNKEPYPALQHVRLNRYHWYYSSARAGAELGYQSRPIRDTLQDAHAWFCDHRQLARCQRTASVSDEKPSARRHAA